MPDRSHDRPRIGASRDRSSSRRWGFSLISLGLATAVAAACAAPPGERADPTPAPPAHRSPAPDSSGPSIQIEREPEPLPPELEPSLRFSFGQVPEEERRFIESVVREGRRFFRSRNGPHLRGPVTIHAAPSLDAMVEMQARRLHVPRWAARATWKHNIAASTIPGPWPGRTQVFVLLPRWEDASVPERAKILLHEWFHVLQYQTRHAGVDPDAPPRWLFEGSAEWWGLRAASHLGYEAPFEAIRALHRNLAAYSAARLPSLRFSVVPGGPYGYPLAFAAVDLLVTESGEPARLMRFWRSLEEAEGVQTAFREAFGMTLSEFYRRFAAHRAAGFSG